MNRATVIEVTSAAASVLLGILLAFQAAAQAPQVQAPPRLPQDKALGEKSGAASVDKAANAASRAAARAKRKAAAEAACAKAKAAVAAAGTGGATTTEAGQTGVAGEEGRAKAAAAVCSGAGEKPQGKKQADGLPDVSKTPGQAPPQ